MAQNSRGINFGGWLVIEKWITPSLFTGTSAKDEYSLRKELGQTKVQKRLQNHYKTFIKEEDFEWLSKNNVSFLRIPVGYWIFEDSGIKYLDFAFTQAKKYNMKILIDLHGAAGSQNGKHHSGKAGNIEWNREQNQAATLKTIEKLAKRYKNHRSFWGMELLNEPDRDIPKAELEQFYKTAYRTVRQAAGDELKIVISDQFRIFRWINGLGKDYRNVVLDRHLYQIFTGLDKKTTYNHKILFVKYYWRFLIWLTQMFTPMIVGEWSAALPKSGPNKNIQYFDTQAEVFKQAKADFYWTYKTEKNSLWSYRDYNF